MFKPRFQLFVKEALLFGLTLVAGLYTAHNRSLSFYNFSDGGQIKFTLSDFIVIAILFCAVFFAIRSKRFSGLFSKALLVLVVFSGTQIVLGSFISYPFNLLMALVFTVLFLVIKNVLWHDAGIILGISGVAAVFGLSISLEFGLILLVILSLYDIVAVYVTKHMVALARGMIENGAILGFLIPANFRGFLYSKKEAYAGLGENFMILGSGDIGLPLIFLSSLIKISIFSAVITSLFSLLGLFLTHILFVSQEKRRAMAALPPIATMTIVGYLISLLI